MKSKPKDTKSLPAHYTFRYDCDSCGNTPVLKDVTLCSVCCFGEADSMWEWLDDGVITKELKASIEKIDDLLIEMDEAKMLDKHGNIDPVAAMLMHIDRHVVDRIERVIDLADERLDDNYEPLKSAPKSTNDKEETK